MEGRGRGLVVVPERAGREDPLDIDSALEERALGPDLRPERLEEVAGVEAAHPPGPEHPGCGGEVVGDRDRDGRPERPGCGRSGLCEVAEEHVAPEREPEGSEGAAGHPLPERREHLAEVARLSRVVEAGAQVRRPGAGAEVHSDGPDPRLDER